LTVVIDTGSQRQSRSTIIEVKTTKHLSTGDYPNFVRRVTGDAVSFKVGSRHVYAILYNEDRRHDYIGHLVAAAVARGQFSESLRHQLSGETWLAREALLRRAKPTIWLSTKDYPMLVRFRDEADPATVEEVPSTWKNNDPSKIRVVAAAISIVNDAPRLTLSKELPWLQAWKTRRVRLNGKDGPVFTNELSDQLDASNFEQGGAQ
jgi:hypothetical protein